MRTSIILLALLGFFIQVQSQETEIEIYLMQNNFIVKGKILESSNDSVLIMVDSLNTMVFAKSELEGKELPVSKEVKKFRRKLMRKESRKTMNLFPGIYQIRNGEIKKGQIMFVLSTIGVIGAISSGVVYVVLLSTVPGLWGVMVAVSRSLIVFATSTIFWSVGNVWSSGDMSKKIEKRVKNRYYYTGVASSYNPILQTD